MEKQAIHRINNRLRLTAGLAMVLCTMLACSTDETPTTNGNPSATLHFTASVVNTTESTTRSASDTYNNALPQGTNVDVFLYASDESGNYNSKDLSVEQFTTSQKWIYTTAGEVDVASGRSLLTQTAPAPGTGQDLDDVLPKFPSGLNTTSGYVDVFAVFFPSGCSVSPAYASIIPSTGSFTFSVNADQTSSANIIASDLLASDMFSTFRSTSAAVNLEMKHRMAKVSVVFNPTESLTADNMPSGTFSVMNVQTAVTVTPTSGNISTTGGTTTVTATVGEPFFLPPQTITAGTTLLQFDLRNIGGTAAGIKTVKLKPTSDLELRDGVHYVLTVDVGVRYINLTTTIRGWTGEELNFDKKIL